jgi:cation:H+ antiporter
MRLAIVLLLVGFVLLVKGADFLVEWASNIARQLGISNIVIGLTVVALGTSLPELIVNVQAALSGSSGLAIGNVLWSNLSNILLIIGITSMIIPLPIQHSTRTVDMPFMILIVLIFWLLVATPFAGEPNGMLTRTGALILLCVFGIFLYYLFFESVKQEEVEIHSQGSTRWKSLLFVVLWLAWLAFGGDLIVENAIILAESRGMSERLIGLTIVALGTSLPELATSITAALKGKTDIAIGNIVWSNIFNIGLILGITGLVQPIAFEAGSVIDLIMVIIASCLLFLSVLIGKDKLLERKEGIVFFLVYVGYMIYSVFIAW